MNRVECFESVEDQAAIGFDWFRARQCEPQYRKENEHTTLTFINTEYLPSRNTGENAKIGTSDHIVCRKHDMPAKTLEGELWSRLVILTL